MSLIKLWNKNAWPKKCLEGFQLLLVSPRNLRLTQGAWSICSDSSISTLMTLSISKGVQAVPLESFNLLKSLETRLVLSILFILRKFCQIFITDRCFLLVSCTTMWTLIYSATKKRKVLCLLLTQRLEILGYFCKCKKKKKNIPGEMFVGVIVHPAP